MERPHAVAPDVGMYPEPHLVDEVLMRKVVRQFSDSVQNRSPE